MKTLYTILLITSLLIVDNGYCQQELSTNTKGETYSYDDIEGTWIGEIIISYKVHGSLEPESFYERRKYEFKIDHKFFSIGEVLNAEGLEGARDYSCPNCSGRYSIIDGKQFSGKLILREKYKYGSDEIEEFCYFDFDGKIIDRNNIKFEEAFVQLRSHPEIALYQVPYCKFYFQSFIRKSEN